MSMSSVGGRYLDKYEKRRRHLEASSQRTIVTDWARVNDPSTSDLSHPITRGTHEGEPLTADDPSRQFFSLMR